MSREQRSSLAIAVAVFIAGGVLLSLEIASSRVLAPFFGNSLYVWGSLIGIVLAGLSTGYWLGGIMADRYPRPSLLVGLLGGGALLVLAIPFVDGWVLDRVVEWDPGPRLNPVIATILLFGLPSVVLGSVSPVAVRLKARSIEKLGRTAGRLFAISTAGSIAGTFLTSFWLIPELGTNQVLAAAAIALVLAAAAVALVERLRCLCARPRARRSRRRSGRLAAPKGRDGRRLAASELVAGVPAAVGRGPKRRDRGGAERATRSSRPGTRSTTIAVVDDDTSRYLRFDSSFQSGMSSTIRTGRAPSTPTISSCPSPTERDTRGSSHRARRRLGPKRTWRDFPGVRIEAVELDPEVVDIAYKHFELPRDPGGRRGRGRPSLRVRPRGPRTSSSSTRLRRRDPVPPGDPGVPRARPVAADPGGLVVTNIIGAVKGRTRAFSARCFVPTVRSSRPSLIHPVVEAGGRHRSVRNIIVVAGGGRRHRSSSCSTGGAMCDGARPAPGPRGGDQWARRCTHPDPGRAGADRRLCADRRPAAPLRLGGLVGSTTESRRRGTT